MKFRCCSRSFCISSLDFLLGNCPASFGRLSKIFLFFDLVSLAFAVHLLKLETGVSNIGALFVLAGTVS